ncbi:MAG: hypothetical protein DMD41_15485 [Gemmatimonadetes bacterium]|uniref:Uncharacterized protein n=1 Tax=Candidatus Segetimicrobium genomatis TaxID=2569760 RepID=A0A537KJ94_9BACT|nr:MAG: hypothetical protein DMD41_15485 [Gemmatimonadota bacterium]TMI95837.1 MAG: hypothetical protein E6H01_14235 [Terrabacteria group bacterium ANGP1]
MEAARRIRRRQTSDVGGIQRCAGWVKDPATGKYRPTSEAFDDARDKGRGGVRASGGSAERPNNPQGSSPPRAEDSGVSVDPRSSCIRDQSAHPQMDEG